MPYYSYRNERTGEVVERCVPIELRDALVGFERVFESGTARLGLGAKRPSLQTQQVLAGYRKLEERGELRLSRAGAKRVKAVWGGEGFSN